MFDTYRKLLDLLNPGEKRRFYLLLGMIMVMSVFEMISVASIVPFLAVLARPEIIETNTYLAAVYDWLGFESAQGFMIFLGICVFVLVVVGLLFSTLTQYTIYRFTAMRGYTISSRMLRGYLTRPYVWFLDQNSADLGATLLGEVGQMINQAMMPAMKVIAQAMVAVLLIALLVVAKPAAALATAVVIGTCYTLIYLTVRKRLLKAGEDRRRANRERFRISNEAMGGIKEVKLMGLEEAFLRRFEGPSKRNAMAAASYAMIGELPRNVLKAIALGGILFFVLFLLVTGDGTLGSVLPVLGLYAFAAMRLFPAVQQIYNSSAALRFSAPVLDKIHADMRESREVARNQPGGANAPPIRLGRELVLDGVHYAYPNAERTALAGLSLTIPARSTVGIVGGTGAGKTTAVDLILGLLEPQAGAMVVDGTPVTHANVRAWQKSVGYVPQAIFLSDDTVTRNIAFGLPDEEIDHAAVERAARLAALHDFVTTELPQGYETLVGEKGVRLSGGQRQRIGIARALYHDPDVLIMDEATSALDNVTERVVMEAVHNLGGDKTIVLIAHRLSTVRDCDVIFMLEHGRLIASGSYDDLLARSGEFRALASGAA
jgi:ABC-type multidrug transport system fused ATPase/permease subunit